MNTFSVRSIVLYSLAIAAAIGFFQVVSSYGETNLKAPTSMAGNYLITAEKLPNCLQNKQLLLKLQQSGIYLNANLTDQRSDKTTDKDRRPTFSGQLNIKQFNLTGTAPICDRSSPIHITGSLLDRIPGATIVLQNGKHINTKTLHSPQQLHGKIWIGNPDDPNNPSTEFMGKIQPSTSSSSQSH